MFRRSMFVPLLAALLRPGALQARPLDVLPFGRMRAVCKTKIKRGRGSKYRAAHLGPNEASTRRHKKLAAAREQGDPRRAAPRPEAEQAGRAA